MPEQKPILDALQTSVIINRRDQSGQIAWTEWRTGVAYGCPANPGDLVGIGASGKIDPCLLPSTTGLTIEVGGVPVADQTVLNFIASTGINITSDAFGGIIIAATGSSTVSVNGTPVSNPNFNNATPAAPPGFANIVWQTDGSGNVSAYYATGGGSGDITVFPDDTPSDIPGYGILTEDPSSIEQIGTAVVTTNNVDVPFSPENSFASPGEHGVDVIPAGTWLFDTWVSVNNTSGNATCAVFIAVYARDTSGFETLLFSVQTPTITSTTPQLFEVSFNGSDYFVNNTDRIVVKYFGVRTSGNQTRTVSFYHAGQTHLSRITAPIPTVTFVPFNAISSGTNTQATMTVDTGASIVVTGSGIVEATELATPSAPVNISGNAPTHEGMLLISQPGNTTAVWADPLMQGLYPTGSSIASPPPFAPPTTIQPVLIGGEGADGKLHNILTTNSGAVVTVSEGLADSANHFAVSTGSTVVNVPGPLTPILSIRPQVAATVTFFLTGMDVFTATAVAMFQVVKNGALTGASFTNVPGSNAQQDTSATSVTGGTVMDTGYSTTGTRTQIYEVQFTVGDTFTLVVASDINGHATKAVGALRWAEQTQSL